MYDDLKLNSIRCRYCEDLLRNRYCVHYYTYTVYILYIMYSLLGFQLFRTFKRLSENLFLNIHIFLLILKF